VCSDIFYHESKWLSRPSWFLHRPKNCGIKLLAAFGVPEAIFSVPHLAKIQHCANISVSVAAFYQLAAEEK
jgi:hypothetical protein